MNSKDWQLYAHYRFALQRRPINKEELEIYMICHYKLTHQKFVNNKSENRYYEPYPALI